MTSGNHVLANILTVNSGNVTAAYINKQNNIIMSEVYLGSGAVVTVQNDDNNGDIKTYALTTAAGSKLTSDYLTLGSAEIDGAATANVTMNTSGSVRLGAEGSLTAANATINGLLSTADAAGEEAGAKITTTYALNAGMLLVGAKGAVKADSVTADDGISLGSDASATVTKGISTNGAFTVADKGSVTANSIEASELKVSGGSMTVTEGINTSGALTVTGNSSVTAGSVTAGGLSVSGSSMAVTAGINTSRDFIVNDKGSVTADSVTAGGLSVNGGSLMAGSLTADYITVGAVDLGSAYGLTTAADGIAQDDSSLAAGTDSVINADTIDVSGGLMSVGGTVNAGSSITAMVLEVLAGGSVNGV